MADEQEKKRSRGKPFGSTKPNARRIAMKIRWTEEEVARVKDAAEQAGEDVSSFVRNAALSRCPKP